MKGFIKDGKFRPTGNRNKSSLKKSDIRKDNSVDEIKPIKVSILDLYHERIENHQDPSTGKPLKSHPDDEMFMKEFGHPARITNKKGKNYSDRGLMIDHTQKIKNDIKGEYPFIKFRQKGKELCDTVFCSLQSGAGKPQVTAQFKIVQDLTDYGLGMHYESDTVCPACIDDIFPLPDREAYATEKEYDEASDESAEENQASNQLPPFDSPLYNEPMMFKIFNNKVTIAYDPKGFKEIEERTYLL